MERKVTVAIALMIAIALFFVGYSFYEPQRQVSAAARQEHAAIERGIESYTTLCYTCHGDDGKGAVVPGADPPRLAPQLNRADFRAEGKTADELRKTRDDLFKTIARGRPNTPMPAWSQAEGGALIDEQINELVTMIMKGDWNEVAAVSREKQAHGAPTPIPASALIASLPPGPDTTAIQAFTNLGCSACHTLGAVPGATGTTGPKLDGIGSRAEQRGQETGRGLSAEQYLRESILNPSAYVVPGFAPVMPPFEGRITAEQLDAIVQYLLKQK